MNILEQNSKKERDMYIRDAKILSKQNLAYEDRKRLKFAIAWLENPNSNSEQIVAATSLVKILQEQYNLAQTKGRVHKI